MSEESDLQTESIDTASDASATPAGTADEAAIEAPHAAQHWWERSTGGQTYLDRYVMPMIVPLCSVAIIIFYVLNVSRVLLSGEGTLALIVAAVITVGILVTASVLSAASQMRTQSLAVFTAVALLVVMLGGWIAVGHSQPEKTAAAVACAPLGSTVAVTVPGTLLAFNAKSFTAKAGCVKITYGGTAGHTLAFDPPGPSSPILDSGASPNTFSWAFTPGTYTFYCTVPGHRQAGMEATLVVK